MIYASSIDGSIKVYIPSGVVTYWPDMIDGRKCVTQARLDQMRSWIERQLDLPATDEDRLQLVVDLYLRLTEHALPEPEELPQGARRVIEGMVPQDEPTVRVAEPAPAEVRGRGRHGENRRSPYLRREERSLGFDDKPDLPVSRGA